MPSTPWKLFTGLFISLFLVHSQSAACGWDPSWDYGFYRFLEPEMSGLDDYRPFYFDWHLLYDESGTQPESRRGANLEEWDRYFNGAYNKEALTEVIYTFPGEEVAKAMAGEKVSEVCAGNPLMADITDGKHGDFAAYLVLAKQCESYNYQPNYWEERNALPNADDPLVAALRTGYQQANDPALKWRYAFQVVRLLHYSGYWKEAIQAYDELSSPLAAASNELMYYWTLSQYAGVLHGVEEKVQSAYLFSKVFDKCPSLRTPAWLSFDISSDQEWAAVLDLCKSDEEKANLFFMRAIVPDAIEVQEIRAIQKIVPASRKTDLLLLREVNKLEEILIGFPFQKPQGIEGGTVKEGHLADVETLHTLVKETIRGNQMANKNLWQVTDAYLDHMAGNSKDARAKLAKLPKKGLDGARARLLDLSILIGSLTRVDARAENEVLKDFYNLKDELPEEQVKELATFRDDRFSNLYESQGELGKAMLARNATYNLIYSPDLNTINDLMAFQDKKDKTLYEKELLSRLEKSYSRNDLLEMKATVLMGKNMLEEAIKIFEKLPEDFTSTHRFFSIGPDPFASNLRDIINCEPGCIENKYTKLSLAKTLLGLQAKAIKEPENAGKYYHLLGNAYFNLSYYGACWKGLAYYRGYAWHSGDEELAQNSQLATAQRYYEKAMEAPGNQEIAALSCMMAAKCDVVETYSPIPDGFNYYDRMNRQFRGTEVYQKAIRECKYFDFYNRR